MGSYTWVALPCFLATVLVLIGVYAPRASVAIATSVLAVCCVVAAGAILISKIPRTQQQNQGSVDDWPQH